MTSCSRFRQPCHGNGQVGTIAVQKAPSHSALELQAIGQEAGHRHPRSSRKSDTCTGIVLERHPIDRLHCGPACHPSRLTGQRRSLVPGSRRLSTSALAGPESLIPCRSSWTVGSRGRAGCGRWGVAWSPFRRCLRREPAVDWSVEQPSTIPVLICVPIPTSKCPRHSSSRTTNARWALRQGPRAYAEPAWRALRETAWSHHAQPAPASARTTTNPATGASGNRMRLMSRPGTSVNAPVSISASA